MITTSMLSVFVFFFFFQAEDGIRDWSVTGVQTCALPILATWTTTITIPLRIVIVVVQVAKWRARRHPDIEPTEIGLPIPAGNEQRSEERRVGKECRSRRSQEETRRKRTEVREGRMT